jgi:hypothetical protein
LIAPSVFSNVYFAYCSEPNTPWIDFPVIIWGTYLSSTLNVYFRTYYSRVGNFKYVYNMQGSNILWSLSFHCFQSMLSVFDLFVHCGVQRKLCFVFVLFFFVLCTLCCQFL